MQPSFNSEKEKYKAFCFLQMINSQRNLCFYVHAMYILTLAGLANVDD